MVLREPSFLITARVRYRNGTIHSLERTVQKKDGPSAWIWLFDLVAASQGVLSFASIVELTPSGERIIPRPPAVGHKPKLPLVGQVAWQPEIPWYVKLSMPEAVVVVRSQPNEFDKEEEKDNAYLTHGYFV
jgi:hypothetical protein